MDISKIRENYDKGYYKVREAEPVTMLPVDHVFDENLSVKANRELVEEHNKKCEEARKVRRAAQASLEKQLRADVTDYIIETYALTRRQAEIVESFTYSEKHSFICDYFASIDQIAEFAEELTNVNIT